MGNAFGWIAIVYGSVLVTLGLISHHSQQSNTTDNLSTTIDRDNRYLWTIFGLGCASVVFGFLWMLEIIDKWSYGMLIFMVAVGVTCTVLSGIRIGNIDDMGKYDKDDQKKMNWVILGSSIAIVLINAVAIGFNIFARQKALPGSGYGQLILSQYQAIRN